MSNEDSAFLAGDDKPLRNGFYIVPIPTPQNPLRQSKCPIEKVIIKGPYHYQLESGPGAEMTDYNAQNKDSGRDFLEAKNLASILIPVIPETIDHLIAEHHRMIDWLTVLTPEK